MSTNTPKNLMKKYMEALPEWVDKLKAKYENDVMDPCEVLPELHEEMISVIKKGYFEDLGHMKNSFFRRHYYRRLTFLRNFAKEKEGMCQYHDAILAPEDSLLVKDELAEAKFDYDAEQLLNIISPQLWQRVLTYQKLKNNYSAIGRHYRKSRFSARNRLQKDYKKLASLLEEHNIPNPFKYE